MSYNYFESAKYFEELKSHTQNLFIPLLDGFKPIENQNPHNVVEAKTDDGAFFMQVNCDGPMQDGETFEKHIKLVQERIKEFYKKQNVKILENKNYFFQDFESDEFLFKIYANDIVLEVENQKRLTRTFNAYFLDNRYNDFYQVSLSIGPFEYPTNLIKVGSVDLIGDRLTMYVVGMLQKILSGIKHKD